jgi:tRNA threonylcarbamoyladenosine biosynthesis protein TsaE
MRAVREAAQRNETEGIRAGETRAVQENRQTARPEDGANQKQRKEADGSMEKTAHTDQTVYETYSEEETRALGRRIGEGAEPGAIYTLTGDLGTGKTVFTQGIAEGLGIAEPVTSPTFTIVQVYEEGRIPFYHFDVYRIGDPSEMDEIGYEDYFFGDGICMIEWAELIEELLPERRFEVRIEKDLEKGYDYRRITVRER